MQVHFIYADGCDSCAKMRKILEECKSKYGFELVAFESEQEEAVDYAIANNISDLPACKIGEEVIQGEKFDANKLRGAIDRHFK